MIAFVLAKLTIYVNPSSTIISRHDLSECILFDIQESKEIHKWRRCCVATFPYIPAASTGSYMTPVILACVSLLRLMRFRSLRCGRNQPTPNLQSTQSGIVRRSSGAIPWRMANVIQDISAVTSETNADVFFYTPVVVASAPLRRSTTR